eukprot:5232363-Amphidinium_carterae.2
MVLNRKLRVYRRKKRSTKLSFRTTTQQPIELLSSQQSLCYGIIAMQKSMTRRASRKLGGHFLERSSLHQLSIQPSTISMLPLMRAEKRIA